MKHIKFVCAIIIILFLSPSCKKELTEGGISFSFSSDKPYTFSQIYGAISTSYNSEPLLRNDSDNVERGVKITGIKPGKYYWYCSVTFSSPDIAGGSQSYRGEIIIAKGKIYQIAVSL